MKSLICCLVYAFTFFLSSCHKQTKGTIIARVGDAELTLEDAKTSIDTARFPFDDQLRRYVAHWVNEELLNQEAKRKGIENSDRFERKLQETVKLLENQYFLEQYIYSDTTGTDEQSPQEYFKNHSSEFFVQEDARKMNIITFKNRERASSFASSVLHGTSWKNAVNTILSDTTAGSNVVSNTTETFYTQHTLFPTELWKVSLTLDINDISFPVKTSIGFSILQVTSSIKEGEPADYILVRDEVRERFFVERRRLRYNELLESLRKRYRIEILLNSTMTSDSNQSFQNE